MKGRCPSDDPCGIQPNGAQPVQRPRSANVVYVLALVIQVVVLGAVRVRNGCFNVVDFADVILVVFTAFYFLNDFTTRHLLTCARVFKLFIAARRAFFSYFQSWFLRHFVSLYLTSVASLGFSPFRSKRGLFRPRYPLFESKKVMFLK